MGLDNGVRETTEERQKHKEDCEALALREASKSASAALVASGAGVFAANTFLPAFRRAIGTSGKAALVVRSFSGNNFQRFNYYSSSLLRSRELCTDVKPPAPPPSLGHETHTVQNRQRRSSLDVPAGDAGILHVLLRLTGKMVVVACT